MVTSNCVINLSADTPQVIREAARVLKLGTVIVTATVSSLAGLLGN